MAMNLLACQANEEKKEPLIQENDKESKDIEIITESKNKEPKETKGTKESKETEDNKDKSLLNTQGTTIAKRFNLPDGFTRCKVEDNSYAQYLRNLPLKEHGAKVHYYDGNIKNNQNVYAAVIDMEIGKKNLQQCADAIMRLRAEYLYANQQYDKIHFNLTNGFRVDYSRYRKGNRVAVKGNKTYWTNSTKESTTYKDFRNYMDFIFTYAGTLSLSQELKSTEIDKMQIGDVLIQGGSPGHAVVVVDMAENSETGEKIYMLAQSYMPAQDIQILNNNNDKNISPWYKLSDDENILTPEWSFTKNDLKRFTD